MPKKYRPIADDYFAFSFITSIYGLLRPVEEKLRAGGYAGPILADFDNTIYSDQNKDTTSPLDFNIMMYNAKKEDKGIMQHAGRFLMGATLTKDGEREFRDYTKKLDKYIDLLMKNTPPEEYAEELSEMKFYKAYLRVVRVFGARELFEDQLAFLINARAYDADLKSIKEVGNNQEEGVSRELWRQIKKNYPYSAYRDAMTDLVNIASDYEENKEKNTYIEQMEYREKYKKGLQNYLSACKALSMGEEESERIAKLYIRDSVIKERKEQDGPEKNIDYAAIIKRVEDQEEKKLPVDPEDKRIRDEIKKKVDDTYTADRHKYDWCNSRYGMEVEAAGYKTNESNLTGNRGNKFYFSEIEAQINAIDNGWPADELIHIERLHILMRSFEVGGKQTTPAMRAFSNKCKVFYNERIKDKPYPSTEGERKAFYQAFYALGQEATELTSNNYASPNDFATFVNVKWDVFEKDLKKSMDKKLSFSEKLVIQHSVYPALTTASVNEIRNSIGTPKRFGHSNSTEFDGLQKAFDKFVRAFQADKTQFKARPEHTLSPEALKILEELRDASKAYLKEKDKDEKDLNDRSAMGKGRYEGAGKAYLLATQLIGKNEEILENRAKEKKEAENVKGRRETREAFFQADDEAVKDAIRFDSQKAGGEEAYNEMLASEARQAAEKEQREPVTDEEKYERLINSCRVKPDAPVNYEDPEQNSVMQKSRIDNLAKMLAAIELQEEGKPFDLEEITNRGKELKNLYSMSVLERVTEKHNGPKELKDALTFKFRAVELKKNLEESLYEVGKAKYRNLYESQNKYQHDLAEILNRNQKNSSKLTDRTLKIVNAINEIMDINLKDNSLVALNAYKLRKANVKIMDAIVQSFDGTKLNDKDAFGPKMALDTLAVLSTYTGCRAVTNKLLRKINTTMTDARGNLHNINIENFTSNYGVKHSKSVANTNKVMENANQVNNPVNHL